MRKPETLEKFLKKHEACENGYEFAKDLTTYQLKFGINIKK